MTNNFLSLSQHIENIDNFSLISIHSRDLFTHVEIDHDGNRTGMPVVQCK